PGRSRGTRLDHVRRWRRLRDGIGALQRGWHQTGSVGRSTPGRRRQILREVLGGIARGDWLQKQGAQAGGLKTEDGDLRVKENIMNAHGFNEQQLQKMKSQPGFIAALDQSGGSTPKALAAYGIREGSWSDEDEMFAIMHRMRTRIITSPRFNGDRI